MYFILNKIIINDITKSSYMSKQAMKENEKYEREKDTRYSIFLEDISTGNINNKIEYNQKMK